MNYTIILKFSPRHDRFIIFSHKIIVLNFEELRDYLQSGMKMNSGSNYQPVMIKKLNQNDGKCTKEEIQKELHKLNPDFPADHFIKYPFEILVKNNIVEPIEDSYILKAFKMYENDDVKIHSITEYCDQEIRVCSDINELRSFENKVDKVQLQVLEEILRLRGKDRTAQQLGWSSSGSGFLKSSRIDKPYLIHPLASGTYTPADSKYAQTIFLSPKTKWGKEIDQKEKTLKINYDYGNSEGKQYTADMKRMKACKDIGLPIGIFFQLKTSKYRCLGLGKIISINENNFVIESFGITDEESTKLKKDVIQDYARYYEKEHKEDAFKNHPTINWDELKVELEQVKEQNNTLSGLDTTKKPLEKILYEINEGNWVIPDFQRTFVWKTEFVRDLLESVFRGYYIGTILLWNVSDDETRSKMNTFPIEGIEKKINFNKIILDGQQRITSLNYAINVTEKSENHPGFFYIDLNGFLKDDEEKFIVSNKNELQNTDTFERLLFPFKYLMKPNEWIKEFKKFLKTQNLWWETCEDQIIQPLRDKVDEICKFEISAIELDNIRYDSVVNIFEKLNSTGKPLDVFALMNNRLSVKGINMTRELLPETELKYPKLKEYTKKMETQISRYIMECISLSFSSSKSCKKADILDMYDKMQKEGDMTPDTFSEMWRSMSKFVNMAITKLEDTDNGFGVPSPSLLPYEPMLPVLASLIQQIKENFRDYEHDCDKKIKKWYWSSVFGQRYSQGVEGRKTSDYKLMIEWFNDDEKIPKFITDFETKYHNIEFEEITKSKSAIYRGVMCLIKKKGASDLRIVYDESKKSHMDHIFPKSKITKPIKNSILNMTWLTDVTNISKSNIMPKEYYSMICKKHFDGNEEKLKEVLSSHLINNLTYDYLLENNFEKFLDSRKEEILKTIADEINVEYINDINSMTQTSPDTKFSNVRMLRNRVESCKGDFYWIDKYFAIKDLEIIQDGTMDNNVDTINILISIQNANEKMKSDFKSFRKEMQKTRNIQCTMKVMPKELSNELHDRYLIGSNIAYDIVSGDLSRRGQQGHNLECERPSVEKWWNVSFDILDEWNKFSHD